MHNDGKIIQSLGGVKGVLKALGPDEYSYQRVRNWMDRGIPAKVKLKHLDVFAPHLINSKKEPVKP